MNPKFQPPNMGALLVGSCRMADGRIHPIAVGDYIKYSKAFFGFVWDKFSWNGTEAIRFVGPDVSTCLGVQPPLLPSLGKDIPNGVKVWGTYLTDLNSLSPMSVKEVLDWMTADLTPDWLLQQEDSKVLSSAPLKLGRRVDGHMPGIDSEHVSRDAWDAFKDTL